LPDVLVCPAGRKPAPRRKPVEEVKAWQPVTNLGRLVKAGVIHSLEEIFLHSIPIKEFQIVDHFFAKAPLPGMPVEAEPVEKSGLPVLNDEVMGIKPVQKQTSSGQRTRFKAFVIVGDKDGHLGFGVKCAKEVATAIRGAIICAKLAIIPVRRGYWGNKIGNPHTVPMKVSGKCGSVKVRLVPAPRGSGVVGSPLSKKVLQFAGVQDCFTASAGHTRTSGNFIHAVFRALQRTYSYPTPDLWVEAKPGPTLYEKHALLLQDSQKETHVASTTA